MCKWTIVISIHIEVSYKISWYFYENKKQTIRRHYMSLNVRCLHWNKKSGCSLVILCSDTHDWRTNQTPNSRNSIAVYLAEMVFHNSEIGYGHYVPWKSISFAWLTAQMYNFTNIQSLTNIQLKVFAISVILMLKL